MNIPKISVIIPVYNTEKYLERCINSVVNQNFRDVEIIIINDCSEDNSLKIIDKYKNKDKRVKIINKIKNEGLSSARNSGIEIAKGEYILHIDSDDWIEQGYLNDIYEVAQKNDADMVITDFYIDYDNGMIKYCKEQNIEKEIGKNVLENCFLGKGCICVWNKLMKRDLYIKNNIRHPINISQGEDLAVTPRLFYFSKTIVKINKAYVHYIQNPKSISNTSNIKKILEVYKALNILENFFKKESNQYFQNFKLNHLEIWLFKEKYDFKNEEYYVVVKDYLNIIKKLKVKSMKMKIINFMLKVLNEKVTFIILWYILKLKNKLKYLVGICFIKIYIFMKEIRNILKGNKK